MRLAAARKHEAERFLGPGLADRAGDADHRSLRARPRGARELPQPGEHVLHHKQRSIPGEFLAAFLGNHRQARSRGQGGGDEIVAVATVALDRKEGVAGSKRAAVDR